MELTVKKEFGEREKFKQVHPIKGYETLRVFIALNVSQRYQLQEMNKKATLWADKIRTRHIPEQEAWNVYPRSSSKTGVPPTSTYPFKKGVW